MSRLMSVAFTERAVLERRKTLTRRKGWWITKRGTHMVEPGDTLTLCRKVMGRKLGEPLIRLCDVEVVSVRREPLRTCALPGELTAEGFPELEHRILGALEFAARYFAPQGIGWNDPVTRIEWRYLAVDDARPSGHNANVSERIEEGGL